MNAHCRISFRDEVFSFCSFLFVSKATHAKNAVRRGPGGGLGGGRLRRFDVDAQPCTAYYNGASPDFTARNGIDVGEDAAKIVPAGSDSLKVQRRRMHRRHYVGARRPCTALLGRRVRE